MLSTIYSELNLYFASKHYGLIAAYIGINSEDIDCLDLVTEGLKLATSADYKSGSFCGFLFLSEAMLKAYSAFSKEHPADTLDEINWVAFHITTLRSVSKNILPNVLSYIDLYSDKLVLSDFLSDLEPISDKQWNDKTIGEIKQALESENIHDQYMFMLLI